MAISTITEKENNLQSHAEISQASQIGYISAMKSDGTPVRITQSNLNVALETEIGNKLPTPNITAPSASNVAYVVGQNSSGNSVKITPANLNADYISHIANKSNPHGVTKAQLGLGNVDNTADADKTVAKAVSLVTNAVEDEEIYDTRQTYSQIDGSCVVKSIKGKSVVMNQLYNVTISGTAKATTPSFVNPLTTVANHVYLFRTDVCTNYSGLHVQCDCSFLTGILQLTSASPVKIVTATSSATSNNIYIYNSNSEGIEISGHINAIDLTLMFGSGNEPTTVDEFAQKLGYTSIDEVPYFDYNEGEVVGTTPTEHRTLDASKNTLNTITIPTYNNEPITLYRAGSVYDEIDLVNGKYIKRVGFKVFDGTEKWGGDWMSYGGFVDLSSNIWKGSGTNIKSANYSTVKISPSSADKTIGFVNSLLFIKDTDYATTVETWEQHLADLYAAGTPLTIYYELATQEEYDIEPMSTDMQVVSSGYEQNIYTGIAPVIKAEYDSGMGGKLKDLPTGAEMNEMFVHQKSTLGRTATYFYGQDASGNEIRISLADLKTLLGIS